MSLDSGMPRRGESFLRKAAPLEGSIGFGKIQNAKFLSAYEVHFSVEKYLHAQLKGGRWSIEYLPRNSMSSYSSVTE